MHKRLVFSIISRILFVVSAAMVVPLAWAVADNPGSRETKSFIITIIIGLSAASLIWKLLPARGDDFDVMGAKDGLTVVGLSWICISLVGALPFFLSGVFPSYTDAFFETVSGFTTTGATVLGGVENMPRGLLFWRSLTHWLGGMGIIVLSVALLPAIGRGAYKLYRAEAPGPVAERIKPGMKETAKTLWTVYFLLSLTETVLLMSGGMSAFDALCHTFGTMATGGFSTKNASLAAYGGYIQWIVILFMFMAGCNFMLHYQVLRGKGSRYLRSEEFCVYLATALTCVSVFAAVLWLSGENFGEPLFRQAAFQVVSILTTTGYTTVDFNLWPAFLKVLLISLMFIGGCAGSTGGGMKVVRVYVALKSGFNSIIKAILPNAVVRVKIDSKPVPEDYVTGAAAYFILYLFLFISGTVLITILESADIVTAFAASIACLSNIGPGLAKVGAVENYAWISAPGKWVLCFLMLAGRLELYSILVLLVPGTWRK